MVNCFRPGRPRRSELKEESMDNQRRAMKEALGGVEGVSSGSRIGLDLIIYEPMIVRRETKME